MENFFNWMSKPVPNDEVMVWFNVHNMNFEKIELYGDIFKSLNQTIIDTYLGEDTGETKIILSEEDKISHFSWCWDEVIKNFEKEKIKIQKKGDHKDYFKDFYMDTFYNQKEQEVRNSIKKFIFEIFDMEKEFTKSDLEFLSELYTLLEKNVS